MTAKKRAAKRKARPKPRRIRRDPLARERALEALSQMRSKGFSMTRAAREAATTPNTIKAYVGSAHETDRLDRMAIAVS